MKLRYRHTVRACYLGYITQAISVNLAPLLFVIFQDRFGISFQEIGLLILVNFSTQIVSDIVTAKYVDRIGYRPALIFALSMSVIGLIMLSFMPGIMPSAYAGLVISVIVYAWGSGVIEVLISPIVDSMPGDAKASSMSLLHAFYCWGQMAVVILTTSAIWVFGLDIWVYLPIAWAIVPLIGLILFTRVPLMPVVPEERRTPVKKLLTNKAFILSMILMICSGSAELTMSQWSSLFAERGLRVSKMTGDLLGMCLFAGFMGIGRTAYGLYGQRFNLRKALIGCAALSVACYATTVFVLNPFISLLGCALCGLSVSLMWPGTLSMSAAKFPLGGTAMFGILAICGDIGGSVGPWMAGAVSDAAQYSARLTDMAASIGLQPDQMGLKAGLLSGMIFPVVMLMALIFQKEH